VEGQGGDSRVGKAERVSIQVDDDDSLVDTVFRIDAIDLH
jgi:hypothetical protein